MSEVSTADVARSAIRRQEQQLEDVRAVLAHCEALDPGEGFKLTGEERAYADVAERLRAALGITS